MAHPTPRTPRQVIARALAEAVDAGDANHGQVADRITDALEAANMVRTGSPFEIDDPGR